MKLFRVSGHLIYESINAMAVHKRGNHNETISKTSQRRGREAFLALMEQYSGAMYKIARSILGNNEDAADAIQETILICFEKIAELRQPRYFKTWMTRILINECRKIIGRTAGIVCWRSFRMFRCGTRLWNMWNSRN